nr:MAG TPA: hypothetical protein [Caudoviricetes sp.]
MILLYPAYIDRVFFYVRSISSSYIHGDLIPPVTLQPTRLNIAPHS